MGSSNKTVSLPKLPTDDEFEDYVAAYIQAAGFYIEKSIIDRQEAEILELDIIFTDYHVDMPPIEKLIEVKSGGWGFTEIFKMLGWGEYLKIKDLNLVVCKEKPNHDFYQNKSKDIGVALIYHPNDSEEISKSELLQGHSVDPLDVGLWRFSYWLEREILKRLKHKKKSIQDRKSYIALDQYFHTLNSGIFFSKNIIKRIDKLYDAYKAHPNITKKVANESSGKEYDEDHENIPDEIFRKTFFNSEFTDITISTYIEHRARLAILKAAVDFTLFEKHGIEERIKDEIELLGFKFSLKNMLPDTFLRGLESIKDDKYFHKYPVFWQIFLWQFGGFILEDYKRQDYMLLSMKSGIPVEHIDKAITSYSSLFPVCGGWFKEGNSNSNIKTMKMMCIPFMGIGANLRIRTYSDNKSLESLALTGTYTRSNLASWNNLVVDMLS